MTPSPLTALSPLDGRYAAKLAPLRPLLSEFGLMQRRVQVEVEWFDRPRPSRHRRVARRSAGRAIELLRRWSRDFSDADAEAIKTIERTHQPRRQGGRVLAARALRRACRAAAGATGFIHFACTSEDINNTSHGLMLSGARADVLLPAIDRVVARSSPRWRRPTPTCRCCRARTARPRARRRVGKEIANVVRRLRRARATASPAVELLAKMNGAVGNYNAHVAATPGFDWEAFARHVVEERLGLALQSLHDADRAARLHRRAVRRDQVRLNTILIDLARDVWGYVSLGYFTQRTVAGEIGSSTMPHKVNPIDFENAEGNFGLANALLAHMSQKLPISRFQRDLTDSTVLRNMGVALGHALLGYDSLARGLDKLQRRHARRSRPISTPPGRCWPSRCRR